jgi:hypothetical protein
MKKFFFCILLLGAGCAMAQTKPPVKTAPQKNAFPKISVTIGGLKGGDISSEKLSTIVDSALIAADENENENANTYTIVRFRLFYKFKSTYRDENSDQKKSYDDMRTSDFTNTAVLPELWRASIKDNIKKGDEMIFDNIIVVLKNGSKIMAPSVKFKVI